MAPIITTHFMKKLLSAIAGLLFAGQAMAQNVENVEVNQFKQYIDTYQQAYILDVRTPREYAAGKIPGSVNININDPQFQQKIAELDPSRPVLVYCLSGGRSSRAANMLANGGFTAVYNLTGGIRAWSASGQKVEKP